MIKTEENNTILSIYPNSYGFGFSVAENFKELIDYGVVKISPIQNKKCLKRFMEFIDFYNPKIVVLREYEKNKSIRSKRLLKLFEQMIKGAEERKVEIHNYTREDIKNVFSQFKSNTKHEICKTIVKWYPQLKRNMPKVRKAWETESYSMSYFDAIALYITHLYLST